MMYSQYVQALENGPRPEHRDYLIRAALQTDDDGGHQRE
jgi:hypothetical protein